MKTFKLTIAIFGLTLVSLIGYGQSVPVHQAVLGHPDYEYANTGQGITYLSPDEREVLRYINLARINGRLFAETILLKHRPDTTHPAVKSLYGTLRSLPAMEPLSPMLPLQKSAFAHGHDLGLSGLQTTTSSNGQPYYDRMHQYVPGAPRYGEVLSFGTNNSLDIALNLLLDAYDTDASTRKVVLSPKFKYAGCAIRPHKSQCHVTVIDLIAKPATRRSNMPEVAMDQNANRPHYGWANCPKGSKVATPNRAKKRSFWIF